MERAKLRESLTNGDSTEFKKKHISAPEHVMSTYAGEIGLGGMDNGRGGGGGVERTEEDGNERVKRIKTVKVGFWNIAGLYNKNEQFWDYVRDFDFIGLIETWVDERQWKKIEDRLPGNFNWKCKFAVKEKNKGRAKGGIITGVNKGIEERDVKERGDENSQERRIEFGDKEWRILTVYSREMKKTREIIESLIEKDKEERLIIGGDFNARIGKEGSFSNMEKEEKDVRNSKDKVKNAEGRKLLEMVEENGWEILNGNMEGDEKGEFTFVGGKGNSVIDYVLIDQKVKEEIKCFRIAERIESDHLPLEVEIYGETEKEREDKKQERVRRVWTEEGRKLFQEKVSRIVFEEEGVSPMMKEMIQKLNEAVTRKRIIFQNKRIGHKGWWDKECAEKKREARKALGDWRRGNIDKGRYEERRKEYKKLRETKMIKYQEKLEEEIEQVKGMNQVWKYINRERKNRAGPTNRIKIQEWRNYFKRLLEGEDCLSREEGRDDTTEELQRQVEEEITKKEVETQIKRLKKGKAAGEDEVENEVWIHGGGIVLDRITKVINKVWRGEGFPEGWKEGIISPIFKKGDRDNVANYRGITLLNTAYKIYAMVLENRLSQELEQKRIIPETQAGFRRERSTIDNIQILNYVVNREIRKKGGRLYTFFADLTAAFDRVDRGELSRIMRERGISKMLRERIDEIYRETRNRVRANGIYSEKFWTTKGLRQGCPLSPALFSLYTADLEEHLRKGQ